MQYILISLVVILSIVVIVQQFKIRALKKNTHIPTPIYKTTSGEKRQDFDNFTGEKGQFDDEPTV